MAQAQRRRRPTIGSDQLTPEVAHPPSRNAPGLRAERAAGFGLAASPSLGIEGLALEIAALHELDPTALRQSWKALFGAEPSPRLGRLFMVRAIAYRLQERRFGGLQPSTQRLLDRICEGGVHSGPNRTQTPCASAGTVLIREWGGASHRVTMLDHGVVYRGRRYKSLSKVARVITGSHWSGPLFFGLKRQAEKIANG